jgi:hypothetical protein
VWQEGRGHIQWEVYVGWGGVGVVFVGVRWGICVDPSV